MSEPRRIIARAPRKLNLGLHVGDVDERGMHPLATVFQAISMFEEVTATQAPYGSGITVSVSGRDVDLVPLDSSNLVHRAAQEVAFRSGVVGEGETPDVHLHIEKAIPVGGGMGGGAADAAAAITACHHLWETTLSNQELDAIGAALGADVTFCLHGGTAMGTGYGEQLMPVLASGKYHWLFALSADPISTGEAYRTLDGLEREIAESPEVDRSLLAALRTGVADEVGAALANDFNVTAVDAQPHLENIMELAHDYGAAGSVICGSGPTVAILVQSAQHARDVKAAVEEQGLATEVLSAVGPVPGARVETSLDHHQE